MTERAARRLAFGIWGLMLSLVGVGAVLHVITRDVETQAPFAFRGADIPMAIVIGSVGVLIASRRSANPIGWLLLATSVLGAFVYVGAGYTILSVDRGETLPWTDLIAWLQNWLWVPIMAMVAVSVSLFPDGKPLSRAWKRFLTFFAPVAFGTFAVAIAMSPNPLQGLQPDFKNPYAVSTRAFDLLGAVGGLLFVLALAATVVSAAQRFKRSSGVSREQMKWLVLSGSGAAVAFAVAMPIYLTLGDEGTVASVDIVSVALLVMILAIPISMGIAMLRHRLYDIDVVINKAVVFAALAAGITIVYVAVVVGIGATVGSRGKPNVGLSVAATALVAVAFQPLRDAARRLANRVVYGKRATPHDVLTVLGQRIAETYSLDDVLPRLAQLVTEATAASHAEVWLRVGGEMRPAAAWPADDAATLPVPLPDDGEIPPLPGAERTFPVRHQSELLGAVAVRTPTNEQLTAPDERLLVDLGSHAGLVLRNVRLIEELRASRQRLVSAQDQERRKIERDLHDGAQQHLVAMSINLRLARNLIDGDVAQAAQLLEQLQSDATDALQTLRDLAHGIYPPLLADRGLAAALTSHAAKAPVPTTVDAGAIKRYPMEVEAAIYFCVLEALQNIGKYARATQATIRLAEDDGHLTFTITDDGAGFDVARVARGAGLTNMSDRLDALGGRIDVESQPGAGTTIRGRIASAAVT